MADSPAVLLYDANGIALAVRDGVAIPANTPGLLLMVSDGANSRYAKGDSSGNTVIVGAGTAGTPAGGVASVQGVAGGLALPISASALPLPAGAATETTLTGVLTTAAFQGRINTLGQKTMANSTPVVMASDQSPIPVTSSPKSSYPGIATGTVTTSATTDVPIRATTYTEQTTNAQRSIASASANDTAAGTGARTVKITYFDQTGAGPYTETISLNGTTAVNTVNTNICFIEELEVMTVGAGGSDAGIITLYVSTAGGGGTIGTIAVGANITFWAHHYVATGRTCYVSAISGHNSSTSNGIVLSLRRKAIGSAAPELVVSDFVKAGGSTGQVTRVYGTPFSETGPVRLVLYGAPEGTPSITHRASFDYYDI